MNKNVTQGKKRQIQGQARQVVGALTNDKLMRLDGKFEESVGVLQEKEGHAQETAEEATKRLAAELKAQSDKAAASVK